MTHSQRNPRPGQIIQAETGEYYEVWALAPTSKVLRYDAGDQRWGWTGPSRYWLVAEDGCYYDAQITKGVWQRGHERVRVTPVDIYAQSDELPFDDEVAS